ncbi:hypothetical protein AX16_007202 [Volvariella volvacea WC 439]|nr:hypothetical protein AX16_007202 [Volvariella volvacea WC 439]
MVGTILITGGRGKTGSVLAQKLQSSGYSTLLTTRDPSKVAPPFKGVKFDWLDQSTFENPWNVDPNIERVYLVVPEVPDDFMHVKPFVDLAVKKGVERFVLLSATVFEKGKPGTGLTHEYLESLGVGFHVLRPSWFFENFTTIFLNDIKRRNEIPSTTKQGKVPFISVDDITDVAKESLLADKAANTDTIIVGPELLTYDEVAEILTEVVGRKITHKQFASEAEALEFWVREDGVPEEIAKDFLAMEVLIADGIEASHVNAERKHVGKKKLRDFLEKNTVAFAPA